MTTPQRVTAEDVTYLGARARVVVVREDGRPNGERAVVTLWRDKAVGQKVEHPAGTITYKRIVGDDHIDAGYEGALRYIEPERVVTRKELPSEIADVL